MSQQHKLGTHATTVSHSDNFTRVVYHSTTIVRWNSEKIILDSGGWKSNTTKTRMNQASNQYGLGYNVYQKDFEWFVNYEGKNLEFIDGMELLPVPILIEGFVK